MVGLLHYIVSITTTIIITKILFKTYHIILVNNGLIKNIIGTLNKHHLRNCFKYEYCDDEMYMRA